MLPTVGRAQTMFICFLLKVENDGSISGYPREDIFGHVEFLIAGHEFKAIPN